MPYALMWKEFDLTEHHLDTILRISWILWLCDSEIYSFTLAGFAAKTYVCGFVNGYDFTYLDTE